MPFTCQDLPFAARSSGFRHESYHFMLLFAVTSAPRGTEDGRCPLERTARPQRTRNPLHAGPRRERRSSSHARAAPQRTRRARGRERVFLIQALEVEGENPGGTNALFEQAILEELEHGRLSTTAHAHRNLNDVLVAPAFKPIKVPRTIDRKCLRKVYLTALLLTEGGITLNVPHAKVARSRRASRWASPPRRPFDFAPTVLRPGRQSSSVIGAALLPLAPGTHDRATRFDCGNPSATIVASRRPGAARPLGMRPTACPRQTRSYACARESSRRECRCNGARSSCTGSRRSDARWAQGLRRTRRARGQRAC